jgi:ribosomal protein S18 acetylase RimI-like enzyme
LRPGRAADYPALRALWGEAVLKGGRDCVPDDAWLRRQLGDFAWEARSRVIEDARGIQGFVLVWDRPTPGGTVARLESAVRHESLRRELLEWGLGLSRAAGAATAQVWWPQQLDAAVLAELGLASVRPFWRMDRAELEHIPHLSLPPGYRLTGRVDPRAAADLYNVAFAEHWRFSPLDPGHLPLLDRPADLSLLAVAADGSPAAVVWCEVEEHDPDLRPQPVGLVGVVGTLPGHRRRGLAASLTAESLRRLRGHGARSASLYVDGLNPHRAYDLYRRLGFEVGFQYEVFETPCR